MACSRGSPSPQRLYIVRIIGRHPPAGRAASAVRCPTGGRDRGGDGPRGGGLPWSGHAAGFGGVRTEIHGHAGARRVVWAGFSAQVARIAAYTFAALPPAPFRPHGARIIPAGARISTRSGWRGEGGSYASSSYS